MSAQLKSRSTQRIGAVVFLVLLIFGALGSFWVLQTARQDDDAANKRNAGRPDYYIDEFRYVRMTLAGTPDYDISGLKLIHFPTDDSFEVTLPIINNLSPAKTPMSMRSKRAIITDDNSKIHMYDDVNVDRGATQKAEPMHMTTEYLLMLPDDEIAKTDKPVHITLGKSVLDGVGMTVNNVTGDFHLSSRVNGLYQPPPTPAR
ncbi:LPS export ABC transporter periplasmic protein LptC [Herbaspirillum sp. RTI4]|uniref:LPS export ABC transporter periplasmic protein LptC n=1 Tax=Herbaspirillum sp. RTI4 TaxID=3048640 RepID=UPI002AB4AAC6|nr:LPS export ABC transporter periplasmic protein LptC [Herbaspirillum sp. RTI4]MDY7577785.1 LPS export ABC transporter periplasmic protein LptC [Herbaspirillum sp. RTI4]MEA9980787.1 LPS export ABC transporter periplasmic protein LptC [Herbaspirillum sp. RTI4]